MQKSVLIIKVLFEEPSLICQHLVLSAALENILKIAQRNPVNFMVHCIILSAMIKVLVADVDAAPIIQWPTVGAHHSNDFNFVLDKPFTFAKR